MQDLNEFSRFGDGKNSRGLIFSNGNEWQEQRRFVMRTLREFGFGKSTMDELMHREILELFSHLDSQVDQTIQLSHTFNISIVNGHDVDRRQVYHIVPQHGHSRVFNPMARTVVLHQIPRTTNRMPLLNHIVCSQRKRTGTAGPSHF